MSVSVRVMREPDVTEARRIFRVAFGTFLGAPEPESFWPDRDFVSPRWRANPIAGLVAEVDGAIAGSNLATNWGSFGFFGPLTIRPDLWNQGIAQSLLGPTMDLFAQWGVRHAGLFTFAHSAKHIGLYQKFAFWPRYLTALVSKGVNRRDVKVVLSNSRTTDSRAAAKSAKVHLRCEPRRAACALSRYSALSADDRKQALDACRELTDSIYEGLDVTSEIRAVENQALGDTVLLWGGDKLEGFAVCHCGEGTEAGRGACYIKFAAARSDGEAFERVLDGVEALAAERGLERLEAGVNLGRRAAYGRMLERGFRTNVLGVAMHRPDEPAYSRPDVLVIDDWR